MSSVTETIVAIATGFIMLAALAVLVSKNANTSQVLQTGGQAFSGVLNAATAPVTSGGSSSWPSSSFGGLGVPNF